MRSLITTIRNKIFKKTFSSNKYWKRRYQTGGNSGPGSYGHLAKFKADVLNNLVNKKNIASVIEFGCGDGNQLKLANYPQYTGYDISTEAILQCRELFKDDPTKEFFLLEQYDNRKAELTVSLDVIFHLIEDEDFNTYMNRLFNTSLRHVAIYSSNQEEPIEPIVSHVRHRRFTVWIEREHPSWKLVQRTPNPYPYNGDSKSTSFADFYIYELSIDPKN